MSGSTMFNVAYGLGCDSKDDPALIRMDKLMTAITQAVVPTQFLVVRILLRYVYDKTLNFPLY
jgi:hypothetical protein